MKTAKWEMRERGTRTHNLVLYCCEPASYKNLAQACSFLLSFTWLHPRKFLKNLSFQSLKSHTRIHKAPFNSFWIYIHLSSAGWALGMENAGLTPPAPARIDRRSRPMPCRRQGGDSNTAGPLPRPSLGCAKRLLSASRVWMFSLLLFLFI